MESGGNTLIVFGYSRRADRTVPIESIVQELIGDTGMETSNIYSFLNGVVWKLELGQYIPRSCVDMDAAYLTWL